MWILLVLLSVSTLLAQPVLLPPPLGLVGSFLQVTATQSNAILRNNRDHEAWRQQRERRVYQVRAEILDETNLSPLDPAALGLRHAEVEAICREIDEREVQLVKVNRDVLNEEQKIKLAALEEAMKLAPVANSGINVSLIHAAPIPVGGLNSIADYLLGLTDRAWPAKQRTGACAPSRSATLLLGLPVQ